MLQKLMKAFRFKIEDFIHPSHFVWIKGESSFKAMNTARQIFSDNKYKITFTGNENNIKLG